MTAHLRLVDYDPAIALARMVLDPRSDSRAREEAAADVLAASPEWTDHMLAREARNAFWSDPHSEHGDNFNRPDMGQIGPLWEPVNAPEPQWAWAAARGLIVAALIGVGVLVI